MKKTCKTKILVYTMAPKNLTCSHADMESYQNLSNKFMNSLHSVSASKNNNTEGTAHTSSVTCNCRVDHCALGAYTGCTVTASLHVVQFWTHLHVMHTDCSINYFCPIKIVAQRWFSQALKLTPASSHFASGLHQTASAKLYRTHFSATRVSARNRPIGFNLNCHDCS